MSTTKSTDDESHTDQYRIDLSDVKGVGPKTAEKLAKVGITSIDDLHLCRRGRGSPTATKLDRRELTISADTWAHLRAVGKAVHYSGQDTVKAKHLTADFCNDTLGSFTVDIAAESDVTGDETDSNSESDQLPEHDTDRLQSALDTIHDNYGEDYSEQVAFEADVGRFLYQSDAFEESEHKLPTGIVQSVMRYRHDAETVEQQRDFETAHKAVLVQMAENYL